MSSISEKPPIKFINFSADHKDSISEALGQEIFEFDNKYFPNPWSQEKWTELFTTHPGDHLLGVALLGESLLGLILFGTSNSDSAHLYKILVDPKERKKELGSELIRRASLLLKKRHFKSVFLEVEESNSNALSLYRKHGYKVLVNKKDFYGAGRNAYAMEALL